MIFFLILNAILQYYDNLMLKIFVVWLYFQLRGYRTFFCQAVTWLDVDAIRARQRFAVESSYAFRTVTDVVRECKFVNYFKLFIDQIR